MNAAMDARKYGKDLYGDAPEEATEAAQRAVAAESSAETGVAISSTAKEREAGAVDGVFGPADVVACSACAAGVYQTSPGFKHMYPRAADGRYKCPHCDTDFASSSGVSRHTEKSCPTLFPLKAKRNPTVNRVRSGKQRGIIITDADDSAHQITCESMAIAMKTLSTSSYKQFYHCIREGVPFRNKWYIAYAEDIYGDNGSRKSRFAKTADGKYECPHCKVGFACEENVGTHIREKQCPGEKPPAKKRKRRGFTASDAAAASAAAAGTEGSMDSETAGARSVLTDSKELEGLDPEQQRSTKEGAQKWQFDNPLKQRRSGRLALVCKVTGCNFFAQHLRPPMSAARKNMCSQHAVAWLDKDGGGSNGRTLAGRSTHDQSAETTIAAPGKTAKVEVVPAAVDGKGKKQAAEVAKVADAPKGNPKFPPWITHVKKF
eukprot:gene12789-18048_t